MLFEHVKEGDKAHYMGGAMLAKNMKPVNVIVTRVTPKRIETGKYVAHGGLGMFQTWNRDDGMSYGNYGGSPRWLKHGHSSD